MMIDVLIKYKRWVSTDRSNLEKHGDDLNDFLVKLTSIFFELTENHFIAKKESGAVLIMDFAKNYSFIVHSCGQSCLWNNAQATIHLFVLYYLNIKTKEISSASFSCIKNHMARNIIIVYAFLKALINGHIKVRYLFLESISYFSDNSPAQYKSYKNFTDLLMHKKDFWNES